MRKRLAILVTAVALLVSLAAPAAVAGTDGGTSPDGGTPPPPPPTGPCPNCHYLDDEFMGL